MSPVIRAKRRSASDDVSTARMYQLLKIAFESETPVQVKGKWCILTKLEYSMSNRGDSIILEGYEVEGADGSKEEE